MSDISWEKYARHRSTRHTYLLNQRDIDIFDGYNWAVKLIHFAHMLWSASFSTKTRPHPHSHPHTNTNYQPKKKTCLSADQIKNNNNLLVFSHEEDSDACCTHAIRLVAWNNWIFCTIQGDFSAKKYNSNIQNETLFSNSFALILKLILYFVLLFTIDRLLLLLLFICFTLLQNKAYFNFILIVRLFCVTKKALFFNS